MAKKYTICEFITHVEQELAEFEQWHVDNFKTQRDRDAYKAGFLQGSRTARGLINLHGGFSLRDPRA